MQLTVNQRVGGSIPSWGANFRILSAKIKFFMDEKKADPGIFGDVAEWSIAADCKSVLNSTVVQIHPSPPFMVSKCSWTHTALSLLKKGIVTP